ncbi:hypothetical protein TUM20985_42990 [Mycobacterium antarcticum]|uniref:hypothetical protein n=1 Tax=unclassified Mycolicibacterium TaxID=2636767 RepID=UPI0023972106|nr:MULTISPECIES: hypothetical protein [unclassified Mycolicibacterium]BDX33752.1 hypothetical protein TUM20985_42990 [Mycolicibacterium sp. TUM20985]GLP76919.1 hypothetical protein TUM20983_40290 [Mycolicibacterium sp. TUM20983]GLP82660.1 hypothetical protein TUM20984_40800 [Mycolicibacterium sp. TUM20984]
MTNLVAMGDFSSNVSAQFLYTTALVLFMALVMPVVAIAVIVKKSTSAEARNSVAGLGTVSLHEELDEFIAAVESGGITMKSLRGEGARDKAVVAPRTTFNSPGA